MLIKKFIRFLSPAGSNDHHHHGNSFRHKSLQTYLNLYHNSIEKDKLFTDREICFSPDIKFGSTIEGVKRNNPDGLTSSVSTKDITILFYRIKVGVYKFRLEMHFFKNKLVFFNYIFRSSYGEKTVLDLFTKKYLKPKDDNLLDFSKIILTDDLESYLEIDNSISLSMHYFTRKYGFFDYLKEMDINNQMQKVKVQLSDESLLLKRI